LGSLNLIDFEALSLGNFVSLQVAPGVTATLSGTDVEGGIVADGLGFWGTSVLGYNTTTAGEQFIGFEPIFDIGTASIEFSFDFPIQAFGAYITGLGTANGDLFVEFDDGSVQSLPVVGNSSGGVLFFGFTDAGAAIVGVTLELADVFGSRDISGVDDVRIVESTIQADIDIKPGSDPNSINPFSRGVIPVAILTTEDFDALTVDEDSVLFGPDEAEKRHKRAHVEDVDGDGDLDLLLHFRTLDTGIAPGDTEACVTGQTYDGVPIEGCDSVRTVPPE
jgi:hypothetical protein